jgi:predicted acylesterase/phospholipase RssA
MVNSTAMTAAHREKTDLLLQPPLAQIDMLNWSAFERAIAAGYEYAARRLEALPTDSLLRQNVDEPPASTPRVVGELLARSRELPDNQTVRKLTSER